MNRFGIKTLIITLSILVIPLIAMQLTDEVNWDVGDFLVGGVLLAGAGLGYEFLSRKTENTNYRTGLGFLILLVLLIIWVVLAVGIE